MCIQPICVFDKRIVADNLMQATCLSALSKLLRTTALRFLSEMPTILSPSSFISPTPDFDSKIQNKLTPECAQAALRYPSF